MQTDRDLLSRLSQEEYVELSRVTRQNGMQRDDAIRDFKDNLS